MLEGRRRTCLAFGESAKTFVGGHENHRYSISESWLDPHTKGPGTHQHPEDDVFFVLGGTMHVVVGSEWFEPPPGPSCWFRPTLPHDFENRSSERASFLNVSAPGDSEQHMPGIAAWFLDRSDHDGPA